MTDFELPEFLHRDVVEVVSEASVAIGAIVALIATVEHSPDVMGVSLLPVKQAADKVLDEITLAIRAKITESQRQCLHTFDCANGDHADCCPEKT